MITTVKADEFNELIEVWEASVRATHDFLSEENIMYFKPLILNQYFYLVQLSAFRNQEGRIIGFAGVGEDKLEMLFIHPDCRGKGVGKHLLQHAIQNMNVRKVDVNEQNVQATAFYTHMGFKIIGRSETDGLGKPFPLLHLELQ
ncbi:GNAT family N-acetyltransferase [Chryseosolibacter indicus]|uniref:GNAT family N-acetyltransferase n=1 Tax=Chryseosolibacter indicus TaxID=2782351 RepID=A0ABS5VVP4_9BACT|nr:GNAT family N-acetyltransferase [Chryseosolibacter indicus]MBT1705296.1 GNAT family N-acetyltransferase [Chryseosolibacter indicus]